MSQRDNKPLLILLVIAVVGLWVLVCVDLIMQGQVNRELTRRVQVLEELK